MDPKTCLDRAENAINAGDHEEAADALADYRGWRNRGGFEPFGGDDRRKALAARLRAAIATRAATRACQDDLIAGAYAALGGAPLSHGNGGKP